MLTIIQDWLALSKIDRGALCDRNSATELGPVVIELIRGHQQLPGAADIAFITQLPPEPLRVVGDAVSISMLVSNLISNAVKYNRPGGTVTVRAEAQAGCLQLQVSDTGIGIPESSMPRLFEEFYRVKSEATQQIQGTGLGLVICKRIVDELDGSIEVASREGEGTTFTVRLPLAGAGADASTETTR
jgi:signal transduction histidine kinase